MSVQFTIRSSDIRRLRDALLESGHPQREKQWLVFLEVTAWAATFRFGERSEQYPVDGKFPGFAKFPEEAIWRVTEEYSERVPAKEITVELYEGTLLLDQSHFNGDID